MPHNSYTVLSDCVAKKIYFAEKIYNPVAIILRILRFFEPHEICLVLTPASVGVLDRIPRGDYVRRGLTVDNEELSR
jgi:hypothetical protein